MHFSSLRTSEKAQELATRLAEDMKRIGFKMPATYLTKWYSYESSEWVPLVDPFLDVVHRVLSDALAR